MSDTICTYKKIRMTPLSPDPEDICPEDIAHALGMIARAGGHFPVFHSVACHCLECCEEAEARGLNTRMQLACLLHDASEAYMADVTRPVKQHMDFYKESEAQLIDVIYRKYLGGLTLEEKAVVKEIDDALLYHEFKHFMDVELSEPLRVEGNPVFSVLSPEEGERAYLECFHRLYRKLLKEEDHAEFFKEAGEKLPQVKAVIFDMDGVIVDTEKLYLRFWREASAAHGFDMSYEQALMLRSTNHEVAQQRFHEFFGPTASHMAIRATRIELMEAYLKEHPVEPKAGIYELVRVLKEKGLKLAVATMSNTQKLYAALDGNHLTDSFDALISQTMVSHGKPDPEIYLKAAEAIGVDPGDCLVVEDSPSGCLAGHRAGCHVVMVPDADAPTEEMKSFLTARIDRLDMITEYLQ